MKSHTPKEQDIINSITKVSEAVTQDLLDKALEKIKVDVENWLDRRKRSDVIAIEELLKTVPLKNLKAFCKM